MKARFSRYLVLCFECTGLKLTCEPTQSSFYLFLNCSLLAINVGLLPVHTCKHLFRTYFHSSTVLALYLFCFPIKPILLAFLDISSGLSTPSALTYNFPRFRVLSVSLLLPSYESLFPLYLLFSGAFRILVAVGGWDSHSLPSEKQKKMRTFCRCCHNSSFHSPRQLSSRYRSLSAKVEVTQTQTIFLTYTFPCTHMC